MTQLSHFCMCVCVCVYTYAKVKSGYERNTCTPMFIAALFTIAKIGNEPRGPLTMNELIKQM